MSQSLKYPRGVPKELQRIEINVVFEPDTYQHIKQTVFVKGMSGDADLISAVLNKIITYVDQNEKEVVIGYKPKE
tara:strand:- start:271 stop:495 length:225 start_codon:yes stop_codon:yes gene_type:complete